VSRRKQACEKCVDGKQYSERTAQFAEEAQLIHVPRSFVVGAPLLLVLMISAQSQRGAETFSIDAYSGEAKVVRSQGRVFVDAEDLARITGGSLRFEGSRIILTLPSNAPSTNDNDAGFSRPFMRAAIEAMASIREWGGWLMMTVQHGYPVENGLAGNTLGAYQSRAADNIAMASAATSTDSDRRGLELLRIEFSNLQAWSDRFVEARRSASAADITTSENAMNHDAEAQKILRCGQFLAQMFASGTFQDDGTCR